MGTYLTNPLRPLFDKIMAYNICQQVKRGILNDPIILIPSFFFLVSVCCPILVYVILAVATVVVTFIGPVIIEGGILTAGGLILLGILIAIFGTFVLLVFSIVMFYFLLQKLNIVR